MVTRNFSTRNLYKPWNLAHRQLQSQMKCAWDSFIWIIQFCSTTSVKQSLRDLQFLCATNVNQSLRDLRNVSAKIEVWLAQAGVPYASFLIDPKGGESDGGSGSTLAIILSVIAVVVVLAVIAAAIFIVRRRRLQRAADEAAAKDASMLSYHKNPQDWDQQAFAPLPNFGMSSHSGYHDPAVMLPHGVPDPLIPGAFLPVRI